MLQIAFIDDRIQNLLGWLAALQPICENEALLATFQSVDAFEEALEEGYLPDLVFTDYHIDDRNGFEVLELIEKIPNKSIYIIAHSAEAWANELLLQEGADEALTKFEDQNPSTTIDDRFRTFDDILELIEIKA